MTVRVWVHERVCTSNSRARRPAAALAASRRLGLPRAPLVAQRPPSRTPPLSPPHTHTPPTRPPSAGVQQAVGVEYRHLPDLGPACAAGVKLLLRDPAVRCGMLLLTPATCAVLGGRVERLEAARRRAAAEWVKPAGGCVEGRAVSCAGAGSE